LGNLDSPAEESRFMNVVALPLPERRLRSWYEVLWALPVRSFWGCFASVLGLMSWNALWRLGDTFVRDYDEGRYGVAASEMLHRHSVLVTTYAGATEFWNLKPPLGYWLLDLSYGLVGETPLGLRLPAALCALVTVALTMLLARRVAGARTAILAGLFITTSFGFLAHHGARSGELDVPLSLAMFAALMLAPGLQDSRAARLAMGLVLSLGFLLKSFAILPFVAAFGLYGLLRRGFASWRMWLLPVCIIFLIAGTWVVARSVAEDSAEFVRRMFVEDLLLRSTTAIDPVEASVWDYPGALFDRFAPWPLLVVFAWALSGRFVRQRIGADWAVLLWCYCLVPLLLFTLARTHHSHYIVPLYPAWAVLGAVAVMELLQTARRLRWAVPAAGILMACVLACELRLVVHTEINDRLPPAQRFLTSLRTQFTPGTVLHTTFAPSYSERFLLQVVDGFVIDDTTADTDGFARGLVMARNSDAGPLIRALPGAELLGEQQVYTLVRLP
jgi:4-amino-4-deoxy-L-arabinose transferase-like glycosyltransferase